MTRFPRLRFSLRTLVIFVLLVGSAGGLWWRSSAGGTAVDVGSWQPSGLPGN